MNKNSAQKHIETGFTLLEILITIGIIAIVSTLVVIVINPSELLKQSRDTQRMSDLDSLSKAIQLYVSTNSKPDLDTNVSDFCLAPSNPNAKIAYSYSGVMSNCNSDVAEGGDVDIAAGAAFSTSNFCYTPQFSGGGGGGTQTWDLATNYSTTTNPSTGGIWRYGTKEFPVTSPIYALFSQANPYSCGGGSANYWGYGAGTSPSIVKNTGAITMPAGGCAFTGIVAGKVTLYRANTPLNLAVARWTTPAGFTPGTYTISGRFFYENSCCGWVKNVYVVYNTAATPQALATSTTLFSATLNQTPNINAPFSITRTIAAGDTIDFEAGEGDGYISGGTGVEATVTSVAAPVYATSAYAVDGTGWLPVNFTLINGGSPLSTLPRDPRNAISNTSAPNSNDFVYRYACQHETVNNKPVNVFELDGRLESAKYTQTDNKLINDHGDNDSYYEVGSSLNIIGGGTNF